VEVDLLLYLVEVLVDLEHPLEQLLVLIQLGLPH
jgi:hypothetical protein